MQTKEVKSNTVILKYIGILLLSLGVIVLTITYVPLISSYIKYKFSPKNENVEVQITNEDNKITENISEETRTVFVDKNFGIYIPKINANAKVIRNVDPYDEKVYKEALKYGVAHAQGSVLPDQNGNVFLFAHSAVNFYERRNYNVFFYLLNELVYGDKIYISYNSQIYNYTVLETKIVNPTEIKYLGKYLEEDTLTLMTCWPAGINSKRTIVTALRENNGL